MSEREPQLQPRYRELEPKPLLSVRMNIENLPNFTRHVEAIVRGNDRACSGFLSAVDGDLRFTFTRYPRAKYFVTDHEWEGDARRLAWVTESPIERYENVTDLGAGNDFRVVLGLRRGYDLNAPVHETREVEGPLRGTGCSVGFGEVFSVRPLNDGAALYAEPAAIIQGPLADLRRVYDVAHELGQERFAVEDFKNGKAYMVETPLCAQPD